MPTTTGLWVDIADVIAYLGADAPASDDAEGQQRLEDGRRVGDIALLVQTG